LKPLDGKIPYIRWYLSFSLFLINFETILQIRFRPKLPNLVSISSTFYARLLHRCFCAKKCQSQNVTKEQKNGRAKCWWNQPLGYASLYFYFWGRVSTKSLGTIWYIKAVFFNLMSVNTRGSSKCLPMSYHLKNTCSKGKLYFFNVKRFFLRFTFICFKGSVKRVTQFLR